MRQIADITIVIPKVIHQTAKTPVLTWEERFLNTRLRRIQPDWTFRFWDDDDNRRLFASVFPRLLGRYDAITRGVVKADIARYLYLFVHGGVYMDTDYKLFRPIDDDVRGRTAIIPIEIGGFADPEALRLGNSLLASHPGVPFWSEVIEYIFAENAPDDPTRHGIVSVAGPRAVTRYILAQPSRGADIHFPQPVTFHPEQLGRSPRAAARDPASYGTHLCWGSWREKPIMQRVRNQVRRKLSAL